MNLYEGAVADTSNDSAWHAAWDVNDSFVQGLNGECYHSQPATVFGIAPYDIHDPHIDGRPSANLLPGDNGFHEQSVYAVEVCEAILADALATRLKSRIQAANKVIVAQSKATTLEGRTGCEVTINWNGETSVDGVYWRTRAGDETIPKSYATKSALVDRLVAAILNDEGVKEKDGTFVEKHFGPSSKFYEDHEHFCLAWDLVVSII